MAVAPQPEAAEAAIDALRAGGNAVDAAIIGAMVQTVVDPLMCGIAGFGSMVIHDRNVCQTTCVDFHAPAPASATPDMWESLVEGETQDGYGFLLRGRVNELGYQSICVPASLRAFEQAHSRHGRLPWSDLFQSAIEFARDGWCVRRAVYLHWSEESTLGRASNVDRIQFSAPARRLFCREDGSPKRVGDIVVNEDYAATLSAIAAGGADAFYKGEIASAIADDIARNDGLLTLADLNAYEALDAPPLRGTFAGHLIETNPPPGGGIMLLEMLNILENFNLTELGHNTPAYLSVVAEAMKCATVDKDSHVGDPRFVDIPDFLLSKDYARKKADSVSSGGRFHVPRLVFGSIRSDTTHISVVDGEGNCVSLTHSLGLPSGVVTEGLGFMHNGCMSVFDPRPGRTGSIAPGKARFSSICPAIVSRDGAPAIVIGAPGATQISMGVLQALLNAIVFGMSMTEAVAQPRFSATSDAIDVSNRIPRSVTRALQADRYEVNRSPLSYAFGLVHAIRIADGGLQGGADPGGDGVAMAVTLR